MPALPCLYEAHLPRLQPSLEMSKLWPQQLVKEPMICFDSEMTDEDIATAMDEIGLALFARGKDSAQVKEHLTREADRVAQELKDEQFHFTR
jgi:hypothetical protein